MPATYHVLFSESGSRYGLDCRFLGEYLPPGATTLPTHYRLVLSVQHAVIFSRDGAIRQSHELNAQGANSRPIMLCANGAIRFVHTGERS